MVPEIATCFGFERSGGAQAETDTNEEKHSYGATKSAEQKQNNHLTTP